MKLVVSQIAWTPQLESQAVSILRKHNIDLVEVAPDLLFEKPEEASPSDVAAVKDSWNKNGFQIVSMQALLFSRPDLHLFGPSDERDALAKYLEKILELGSGLGARRFVFGSPKNRLRGGLDEAVSHEIAIEFFSRVGSFAYSLGGCICVEPNPREYGADFVNSVPEAISLIERVNSPGFRLHLDTGCMTLGGEQVSDSIISGRGMLEHFHASEPFLSPLQESSHNTRLAARDALVSIEYSGLISMEMRAVDGDDQLTALSDSIDLLKRSFGDQAT